MTQDSRRFARDLVVGVIAAAQSARRIESGLGAMLAWPEGKQSRSSTNDDAERAVRITHRTLRVLATIPGRRWRNTCLFRSVAECAVRREYGNSARIVIGVDKVADVVVSHAWVERAGANEHDSRAMRPLHSARHSAVAG